MWNVRTAQEMMRFPRTKQRVFQWWGFQTCSGNTDSNSTLSQRRPCYPALFWFPYLLSSCIRSPFQWPHQGLVYVSFPTFGNRWGPQTMCDLFPPFLFIKWLAAATVHYQVVQKIYFAGIWKSKHVRLTCNTSLVIVFDEETYTSIHEPYFYSITATGFSRSLQLRSASSRRNHFRFKPATFSTRSLFIECSRLFRPECVANF